MACGMLAMKAAGVPVEEYHAYEIDKYAIQVAIHNFPTIQQHGDVYAADFTQYEGIDYLIGGSPCTYWSIAQTKNRETVASGQGWELFSQYVRALHETKPKFFIYENNKSMSKEIRESIDKAFGFESICINSALVSAQNRQRLYWVGKRSSDGTYHKVDLSCPPDKGILLQDVLDITVSEYKGTLTKSKRTKVAEPIRVETFPNASKNQAHDSKQYRIYSIDGKSTTLCENGGGMGAKTGLYAQPLLVKEATKAGFTEISPGDCVDLTQPNSKTRRGRNMKFKSNCLMTSCHYYQYCGTIKHPIYEVRNGMITIHQERFPIKLIDGYYIIRKLTVTECKRLQTVPDWYDMSVISDSQSYKCLGNGWTVDVIAHIITSTLS